MKKGGTIMGSCLYSLVTWFTCFRFFWKLPVFHFSLVFRSSCVFTHKMTKFLIAVCAFLIIFECCNAQTTETPPPDCTRCPDGCYQHHVLAEDSIREALRCCTTKTPCSLAYERNLDLEDYYDCLDRAGQDHGKAHDCARKLNLPS